MMMLNVELENMVNLFDGTVIYNIRSHLNNVQIFITVIGGCKYIFEWERNLHHIACA